ncbi:MAG: 6-pyruvoyl tetrahydrobiopterin synthase [Planctomycetaceae bacterium]|nr:6-pyruvoyl tetrahydrobiopterin synthase [Planctomycetaceae bacterium]MBP63643.1 6-pyruvoyl tetrahydrobiopterin synthase [Planctomycetaceae bacterium]
MTMSECYTVRVSKDYLGFNAAHFITYAGNICERLHGHNYRVAAEVEGPLNENHYVIDFIWLRDTLMELVADLDHRVLLPTDHETIRVTRSDQEIETTFDQRRWVFPRGDCVLLPIANTTSERLAWYLAGILTDRLAAHECTTWSRIRLEVDENEGQVGIYEKSR